LSVYQHITHIHKNREISALQPEKSGIFQKTAMPEFYF